MKSYLVVGEILIGDIALCEITVGEIACTR
jgi:hypothetical protein